MVVTGRVTVKVAPFPSWLETRIRPPCFATIPCDTLSPRPVPRPFGFVVKKRIEDGMKNVLGNAASGINDFHRYIRGSSAGSTRTSILLPFGRSVDGVEDEI